MIVVQNNKKKLLLPEKKSHLSILPFNYLISNKFNEYKQLNQNINPEKDLLILPYSRFLIFFLKKIKKKIF